MVVRIIAGEGQKVAKLRRWFSEHDDVRFDPLVNQEIVEFIRGQAVRSVVGLEKIIGCPHEEGIDYPSGEVCPSCPYWAHRDRWSGRTIH